MSYTLLLMLQQPVLRSVNETIEIWRCGARDMIGRLRQFVRIGAEHYHDCWTPSYILGEAVAVHGSQGDGEHPRYCNGP